MGAPPPEMTIGQHERVLSREAELAQIGDFAAKQGRPIGLVVVGESGMGKTALWDEALTRARDGGITVLWSRASAAETSLSFAALRDLVDGVGEDVLAQLPPPQRHAIDVAVHRADPDGTAPDPLAISGGFLGAIRTLADRQPLLIAIDDAQWLDASSHEVLTFAARRLTTEPIHFLLSRRPGHASQLERELQRAGVDRLELSGLSLGAIGQLLVSRLSLELPRRLLRQLHGISLGNPLISLELGRVLAQRDPIDTGDDLQLPVLDDDVFGARVLALAPPLRRAVLAVALSADLRREDLETLVEPDVVEDGVTADLFVVERGRVRPTHPLLAVASRQHATARERRDMHRSLAVVVQDPLLQARHLAAATAKPDADVANLVAAAARSATERGAADEAEDLARQALRLTPDGDVERAERIFLLARCHLAVGDERSASALLTLRMDELPPGRIRARGHILLGVASDVTDEVSQLELALAEAHDDPEVRAEVLSRKSLVATIGRVRDIDQAEVWAREGLDVAQHGGSEVALRARAALGWALALRGKPLDELGGREVAQPAWGRRDATVDRPLGVRSAFRGEIHAARRIFRGVLDQEERSGEFRAAIVISLQLCELELRSGDVYAAQPHFEYLGRWATIAEMSPSHARLRALEATLRGRPDDVRRYAALVRVDGQEVFAAEWDRIETDRACGISALYEGDVARATQLLGSIWDLTQRAHVDDPGAFPVAGDLVEALTLNGDAVAARDVTERLLELATAQHHPWGLAMATRCDAFLRLQDHYDDDAVSAMQGAAHAFEELGLGFEASRTNSLLGSRLRRHRKSGDARRCLERAAARFEELGCTGWADQARAELARIGGRRPSTGNLLTPSERRVVDLAASGLSNKEIARQLFVSVYTVEEHLSNAYVKLGVRSRAQLARLPAGPTDT